jgi:hypothetical protein
MIFFRKGVRKTDPKTGKETLYDLEGPINFSVFPGHRVDPTTTPSPLSPLHSSRLPLLNSSNTRNKL